MILDEVHRTPGLFPILRGIIDGARREGQRSGLYLLLGSAALELLRQSGETLAGRVSFMELAPFDVTEAEAEIRPALDHVEQHPDAEEGLEHEEERHVREVRGISYTGR